MFHLDLSLKRSTNFKNCRPLSAFNSIFGVNSVSRIISDLSLKFKEINYGRQKCIERHSCFRHIAKIALIYFKRLFLDRRQFLAAERPLKIMKKAYVKSCFIKIFEFFSWIFGPVKKRLDKKAKVNFKTYRLANI